MAPASGALVHQTVAASTEPSVRSTTVAYQGYTSGSRYWRFTLQHHLVNVGTVVSVLLCM